MINTKVMLSVVSIFVYLHGAVYSGRLRLIFLEIEKWSIKNYHLINCTSKCIVNTNTFQLTLLLWLLSCYVR